MLKTVKLYGELAERYGKDWSLDIDSPREAVRALIANNPGFAKFVSTSEDRGMGYMISVGGTYLEDPVNEMFNPSGKQEIKIIPVILGAKNKDALKKIVVGLVMIYIGYQLGGAVGAMEATTATEMLGVASMSVGKAMVLGGIGMLLSPTPKDVEDSNNYSFNGAINTTKQGVPVPICYGQLLVGSSVISSGISEGAY